MRRRRRGGHGFVNPHCHVTFGSSSVDRENQLVISDDRAYRPGRQAWNRFGDDSTFNRLGDSGPASRELGLRDRRVARLRCSFVPSLGLPTASKALRRSCPSGESRRRRRLFSHIEASVAVLFTAGGGGVMRHLRHHRAGNAGFRQRRVPIRRRLGHSILRCWLWPVSASSKVDRRLQTTAPPVTLGGEASTAWPDRRYFAEPINSQALDFTRSPSDCLDVAARRRATRKAVCARKPPCLHR